MMGPRARAVLSGRAVTYNRLGYGVGMNADVLRLIDANANRAREALRVVEDYARFAIDDETLCAELKQVRHRLTEALGPVVGEAILHRDVAGDVGTDAKTHAELVRGGTSHVVTAAGKRLGEALRVLEEFLKIDAPDRAAQVEKLRYTFYDIEQRVARTLRSPGACAFASVCLYVLITESACKLPWLQTAKLAIEGGADCLQLREKDLEGGEFLSRAKQFVELCRSKNVISIINDRPDVAILSGANGVHLGQGDLPCREARKLLGQDKIIGVSTHEVAHAKQAVLDGADYIGVGPVFHSATKPRDFLPGLEYAREVAAKVRQIPSVAIAGITEWNVDEVLSTGIRAIAVTSAVTGADDPREAARKLKSKFTPPGVVA